MDEIARLRAHVFGGESPQLAAPHEPADQPELDGPLPEGASFGDDFDEDDELLDTFGTPEVHTELPAGLPEPAEDELEDVADEDELPAPPPAPLAESAPVIPLIAAPLAPAPSAEAAPAEAEVEVEAEPASEEDSAAARVEAELARYARRRARARVLVPKLALVGLVVVLALAATWLRGGGDERERSAAAALPPGQANLRDATRVLDQARLEALRHLGEQGTFRGFEVPGLGVAADEYDVVITAREGESCFVSGVVNGSELPVTRAPDLTGCTPEGVAETQAALDERSERIGRSERAGLEEVAHDAATLALQYARGVTPASFDGLPDPVDPLVEVLHAEGDVALLRIRRDQQCLELLLRTTTQLPLTPAECS